MKIGTRVQIKEDADIFNLTKVCAGETGTVVAGDEDSTVVGYIKLDKEHFWLAEWNNVLHVFSPEDGEVTWDMFEEV